MRTRVAILSVLVGFFAGCAEEKAAEPEVAPPPPPTVQEIQTQIETALQLTSPLPPPTTSLSGADAAAWLGQVRTQKQTHSATPNGQQALRNVSKKFEEHVTQAEQAGMWDFVLANAEAHEALNPGTTKYVQIKQRAVIELKKPRVKILMIIEQDGITTAKAKVTLPLEGKTYDEIFREGEILHGIRLVEFIGKARGARFEYLETGEMFDVKTRE
ncbi:MAG: hypothetical protein AAB353_10205 [Candidatus Hydrogenedentota bacterium]